MNMIQKGLSAALDLLLPRICIVCGRRLLLEEKHLCLECTADLPLTRFERMSHNPMADRFNDVIQKHLTSDEIKEVSSYEPYAYATALFFYKADGDYKQIPYQLKYHGNVSVGRHFGRMLGRRLAGSGLFQDVDIVIPVPLHRLRRWKRGYNQAEILAAEVASALGASIRNDILVRTRRTKTQTKLEVEEKIRNVKGAFEAVLPDSCDAVPKHILLIDDVFTTGSTLGECFSALRSVFPPEVRISVATLAFVGGT